jgi:hypothetical protein
MFNGKTIRRFRQDGEAYYGRTAGGTITKGRADRPKVRRALGYVGSVALAAVLAISGIRLLGAGRETGGKSSGHGFSVVAYASTLDGEVDNLVLGEVSVTLPAGRLSRGEMGYAWYPDITAYDANWQAGCLKIVGEGIESVNYTASSGAFANCGNFFIHPDGPIESHSYTYVRRYPIDKETYDYLRSTSWSFDVHNEEYLAYLRSGALDHVIGKDLRVSVCEDYQFSNLALIPVAVDSNGNIEFMGGYDMVYDSAGIVQVVWWYDSSLPQHYEMLIRGSTSAAANIGWAGEDGQWVFGDSPPPSNYWEIGQAVTVGGGEGVYYCPPFWALEQVCTLQGDIDYPSLGHDIVTVTITMASGEVYTRYVLLSLDQEGRLCARLSDSPPD